MIDNIKLLWACWQAELERRHELNIKLEALTDHGFLDRAIEDTGLCQS